MFSFYGKSFHGAHFAEPTVFLNNLFPKVDPCPIMLKLELICTFTEALFIPETMQRSSRSPVILMVLILITLVTVFLYVLCMTSTHDMAAILPCCCLFQVINFLLLFQ